MTIRSPKTGCGTFCLALLLAACSPQTDRDRYAVGESGVATFRNDLAGVTLYLGGCGHFDYEKRVGNEWVSQGRDIVCVWEGLAQPVPPGEVVTDPILAREPGTWRLRYEVGVGCSKQEPLRPGNCDRVVPVTSNEFQVVASISRCVVAGCSSELCVDASLGDLATPCIWLPEYECLRDAHCGPFGPEGSCGWEPTPELGTCLESAGS